MSLGLSEPEFWESSLAKVMDMYRLQIQTWARDRDYFPAEIATIMLNKLRRDKADRVWSADDLLHTRYLRLRDKRAKAHDPDRGAQGDWRGLKTAMRGVTTRRLNRRRQQLGR